MSKRANTKWCAVYARVSTPGQAEGDFSSIDNQCDTGDAIVHSKAHEGWTKFDENFVDAGYSGANLNRPAIQRILHLVGEGRLHYVIVTRSDRLSRSLEDSIYLFKYFWKMGVNVYSASEGLITDIPIDQLNMGLRAIIAEYDLRLIGQRTQEKALAARRKGIWTGGYLILGFALHPSGGGLVTDPEEAPLVIEIFRLYLRVASLQKTCEILAHRGWTMKAWTTRDGKPTGGHPFTKASLQRLLTNVLYIGKMTCGDEVHEGQHEAIVPTALFNQVQSLLNENRRTRGAATRNKHGFLLRGRVACSACGASRTANTTRKGPRAYKYYVCSSAQQHGYQTCPCPSVPAYKLEGLIVDQIQAIGHDRDLQNQVFEAARARHEAVCHQLNADFGRATKKLSTTQDEIKGLLKALADGSVTGTSIASRIAELETTLETLDQKVTDIQAQIDSHSQLRPDPTDLAESLSVFDEIWEVLLQAEKERIISLLIDSIDYDGTTLGIEFSPAGVRLLSEELKMAHGA